MVIVRTIIYTHREFWNGPKALSVNLDSVFDERSVYLLNLKIRVY